MSNVFTYTTEIKQNNDNQLLVKYISDYLPIFNKIQRIAFHRIKNSYIQYGASFVIARRGQGLKDNAKHKNKKILVNTTK